MKARSKEALEKKAAESGMDISISKTANTKTLTATRKKHAKTVQAREKQKSEDQMNALTRALEKNAQIAEQSYLAPKTDETSLLTKTIEQNTKLIEKAFAEKQAAPVPNIQAPREWKCTVKRDNQGFIESFSLKQILN